jgi:hypothetical protein
MHYSTILLGLIPALAFAAPSSAPAKRQSSPPTIDDIIAAQVLWQQDTQVVSNFLNYAAFLSTPDLLNYAQIALNAENDELTHKAVLDSLFVTGGQPDAAVIGANNVLVNQGTFQSVVNFLQDMVNTGNVADVQAINSNRCANVLPAIDAYFLAVAQELNTPFVLTAARPLVCQ